MAALLEGALSTEMRAQHLEPAGRLRVREASPWSSPHSADGRPKDDPDAVLYRAEVDVARISPRAGMVR